MPIADSVRQLLELHEKAKKGALAPDERLVYETRRTDFSRAMLSAQKLMLRPGETYRRALRVAHAVRLELALTMGTAATVSLDLSAGGFAALVPMALPIDKPIAFTMRVSLEPLEGMAHVVSSTPRQAAFIASFAIDTMSAAHRERLEAIVFEAALARFGP